MNTIDALPFLFTYLRTYLLLHFCEVKSQCVCSLVRRAEQTAGKTIGLMEVPFFLGAFNSAGSVVRL